MSSSEAKSTEREQPPPSLSLNNKPRGTQDREDSKDSSTRNDFASPSPHGESRTFRTSEPASQPNSPWAHGHQDAYYHQDPSIWREYSPHHEYTFPPRPYFHPGFYEDDRWASGRSPHAPVRNSQAEEPSHHVMVDSYHHDAESARRLRDYGYRPLYHLGEMPPSQNHRGIVDTSSTSYGYASPPYGHSHYRSPPPRQEIFPDGRVAAEAAAIISAEKRPRARKALKKASPKLSLDDTIGKVGPYDIFCGRGVPSKPGPGNVFFNKLVAKHQLEYISCPRNEKPPIATKIIAIINAKGGRFLRRSKVSSGRGKAVRHVWEELPEGRVYERVCQALREGAPQIRQRLLHLESETKKRSGPTDKENSGNQRRSPTGWM